MPQACSGILAALIERRNTGCGTYVEDASQMRRSSPRTPGLIQDGDPVRAAHRSNHVLIEGMAMPDSPDTGTPGSSLETLRKQIRDFLHEAVPPDIRAATRAHCLVTREQAARWHRILHARGWAAPGWPREHGGPGWSLVEQAIFREELAASDAPYVENLGIDTIGPTLIRHGTPEQCRRFLPGMLTFDDFWAQGYSEPDAGSDLASLRTVARRDGDMWVVNGTKIWQSLGHWANWALVLARTDTAAQRKQNGISVLLIDLRSPGVTVRPIRYINGSHLHVQMFFDDVRVPAANLVGVENSGWAIAKGLLVIERLFVARVAECKAELSRAAVLVAQQHRGDDPALRMEHALLRRSHATLDIRMRALEAAWWPAVQQAAQGGSPQLESSLLKLEGIQLLQDLHLFSMDAHGTASLAFDPEAVEGRPGDGLTGHAGNLPGPAHVALPRQFTGRRLLRDTAPDHRQGDLCRTDRNRRPACRSPRGTAGHDGRYRTPLAGQALQLRAQAEDHRHARRLR
ncbi:acyl-CoA dehydrogenase family protein [Cupriavidus basilensis]|uniref:acyl-CoA dehydrogenase family protein n=1 Tax=Cupriavidus basilensis TaxID=68895 RepID=UPI001ED9096E|nr:acyl-CoA dehydrogenase family protein [Cupriavidus basilensis]